MEQGDSKEMLKPPIDEVNHDNEAKVNSTESEPPPVNAPEHEKEEGKILLANEFEVKEEDGKTGIKMDIQEAEKPSIQKESTEVPDVTVTDNDTDAPAHQT
jgi:hypothetical protein